MNIFRRRLIWMALPLVLVIIVLLGLAADSWLESAGGRRMLQRELSKSLGLPVRLEGAYALKLFPRLQITGTGLVIDQPAADEMLAFGRKYSAAIELKPFIHREVRISSIGLHGGFVDYRYLSREAPAEHGERRPGLVLPEIASLEISDFSVRLAPEGRSVLIRKLQLTGFRPGQAALLEIDAGLLEGAEETARLNLHGDLQLAAENWSSKLAIRQMELNWHGRVFTGLSGVWQWDQLTSRLAGKMAWQEAPNTADLRMELTWGPSPAGSLEGDYRAKGLPEPLTLGMDFTVLPDAVVLQHLAIEIAGQSLAGGGCILMAEPAGLHLSLEAGDLDLDRIYSMMPAQQDGDAELPFELAIRLHAKTARFAGAEATGVDVGLGRAPDCALAAGTGG